MIFILYPILFLYFFCFASTLQPILKIFMINGHDFGSYTLAQLLFCCFLSWLIIFVSKRGKKDEEKGITRINLKDKDILIFIIFAIISGFSLRLYSMLQPWFTTDIARYFSDGFNIDQGKNPYTDPIAGDKVAYPQLRTIYPVLSQFFFYVGYKILPQEKIYKYLFGLLEICMLLWIYRVFIFRKSYLTKRRLLLFSFFTLNPLSIYECHAEGHVEIASVFPFLWGATLIHLRRTNRIILPAFLSYISFLTKFYGIILYPLILLGKFRYSNPYQWKKKVKFTLFLVLGIVSLFVVWIGVFPFFTSDLTRNQSGLYTYLDFWYFNHFIIHLLQQFLSDTFNILKSLQWLIIVFGALAFIFWFVGKISTHEYLTYCIASFLIFFPVQHPWYFLLSFYVILFSRRYMFFGMLLSSSIGISYISYGGQSVFITSLAPWLFAFILTKMLNKKVNRTF